MSYQDKPSLDEALAHFGVKGMKWGVRKKRDLVVSKAKAVNAKGREIDSKIIGLAKKQYNYATRPSSEMTRLEQVTRYGVFGLHGEAKPSATVAKGKKFLEELKSRGAMDISIAKDVLAPSKKKK